MSRPPKPQASDAAVAECRESIEALHLEISRLNTELKEAAPQALTISPPREEIARLLQGLPSAIGGSDGRHDAIAIITFPTNGAHKRLPFDGLCISVAFSREEKK
jgi:hypothetical protein